MVVNSLTIYKALPVQDIIGSEREWVWEGEREEEEEEETEEREEKRRQDESSEKKRKKGKKTRHNTQGAATISRVKVEKACEQRVISREETK